MRVARTEGTPQQRGEPEAIRCTIYTLRSLWRSPNRKGGQRVRRYTRPGGEKLWFALLPTGPALPKRCTADEQDNLVPASYQEDSLFTGVVSWLELTYYVRCVGAPVHGENSDGRAPMGNEQSEHCLIGWRVRLYAAKLVLHRPHTGPCPDPRPANPVVLRTATNHSRLPTTAWKTCRRLSLSGQPDSRVSLAVLAV